MNPTQNTRLQPLSPTPDEITTPVSHTTRRIIFDSGAKGDATKAKTRVVASRFMQAPTPGGVKEKSTAIAIKSKPIINAKVVKPPQKSISMGPQPKHLAVPNSTVPKSAAAPSGDNNKLNALLLNNLLTQYCYTNAIVENIFEAQQERAEKVLYHTYGKLQQLREETHKQKCRLYNFKYTRTLEEHLGIQDNGLNANALQEHATYYHLLAERLYLSTHRLPLINVQTSPPMLTEILQHTNDTLLQILQVIQSYHQEISCAASTIGDLHAALNQEIHETTKYKALLRVLQALDNHLASLWTQNLEEIHHKEI